MLVEMSCGFPGSPSHGRATPSTPKYPKYLYMVATNNAFNYVT